MVFVKCEYDEYGLCFECDKRKEMTAAKRAKELGAKSLKDVCDAWGVTHQAMQYQFKENPSKFDIIVLGVVESEKIKRLKEREMTYGD